VHEGEETACLDAFILEVGFPETNLFRSQEIPHSRGRYEKQWKVAPCIRRVRRVDVSGGALLLGKKTYPLAGIFPVIFSLEKKPQAHGYTILKIKR